MLTVTKISPGAGYRYLTEQVASGRHDFRPAKSDRTAYYVNHEMHGEAPGWWAGTGTRILDVDGAVTEPQMKNLIGAGRHPITGQQLGQVWRTYEPMTDQKRRQAVEQALSDLPADATPEQRDRVWLSIMEAPDRQAVSGYDVTVSPVKSVSILWAFGDDQVKTHVMAAHHAGVRAMLGHLERHGAYTRTGTNGLRQVDVAGLAAMVFDHRMSRETDPQIHSHVVISAKVRTADRDGAQRWLALDGKALYQATIAARIAYERGVEVELTRRMSVRFEARAGSTIREIAGISPASVGHYSKRRGAIETEMGHRTGEPEPGRAPVSDRRWRRRAQDATLRTRRPKQLAESTREAARRWQVEDRASGLNTAAEVRTIIAGRAGSTIASVGMRVLRRARAIAGRRPLKEEHLRTACTNMGVEAADQDRVVDAAVRLHPQLAVERAVRDLAAERAVWGIEHLELAIGRVVQADAGACPAADWTRVQALAHRAIAGHVGGLRVLTPPSPVRWGPLLLRGSDRQSVYTRHRDLVMTTRSVLAAESDVLAYAARRGARAPTSDTIRSVSAQLNLSVEKAEALRFAIGDDRRVTGIVGPAGSGKTYLQRAVALAADQSGIPIVGLTVGQNAAEILAQATRRPGGTGIRTENIAMWLHAQRHPPAGTTPADWTFTPGQWVIVDEASQASSADLARLVALLAPVGGKLILVGDPAQINAVGPGGLFRYLAGMGATTELSEIHRFHASWEGPASLRIRAGDPTVLAEYDRRNRIIGGHREQLIDRMLRAWAADVVAGRDTLMLVDTQAEAADLAQRGRRMLIHAGVVRADRQVKLADGSSAAVGDIVVTRRNDRRLTDGAKWVANRDRWAVTDIGPDHQLTVRNLRTGRRLALPAEYVAHHVQLGYAATVDSAQGQTVDTARSLIDDAVTHARLYVMLTRGQSLNEAYVVTSDRPAEGNPPQAPKSSIAILADILRRPGADRSATETEQRLWADVDALHRWGPVFDDLAARADAHRYVTIVRATAGDTIADRLSNDPALPALSARLTALREAGFDPAAVLESVVTARELHTAEDVAAVLAWRIDTRFGEVAVDPRQATTPANAASYTDRIPAACGDLADALHQVARLADARIEALAEQAATDRPDWASGLGTVPDDDTRRGTWLAHAAVVVAYRDCYRITDSDPIGPEPSHRNITQWGAWHRARIVLGTATAAGRVAAADTAELDRLVAAQRAADAAAPPYAGDELRAAHLARASAVQRRDTMRLDLAAADSEHADVIRRATVQRPRWWHAGPSRRRAVAEHANARAQVLRFEQRVEALRDELPAVTAEYDHLDARVQDLEARHNRWMAWYLDALPTRYLGLAAAAERTRRLAAVVNGLQDAVRRTTDRARAIDATQPVSHAEPVRERLAHAAEAARLRVGTGLADDVTVDDPGVEIDLQS